MGKQVFEIETFPPASLGPRLTETVLCDSLVFISRICPEPGRNGGLKEEKIHEKWGLWAKTGKVEAA